MYRASRTSTPLRVYSGAVRDGFCDFGVLPHRELHSRLVNAVYDLLAEYRFTIVRSLRLKIDHNLLARPGVKLEDVREVISHEQAVAQCADYLDTLGVKVTVFENTAEAAAYVAQSDRTDLAALCSRSCAPLYDLNVLAEDVQDSDNNYTRFVGDLGRAQDLPRCYPHLAHADAPSRAGFALSCARALLRA